jgi:chromosome segregation ATPase
MLRNCAYRCAVLRADLAAVKEHAAVLNGNEAALQSKIQQSNESLAFSERSLLDLNAQLAEKAEQISALERELDSEKHAAITLKTVVDTEKQKCSALQKSQEEVMIAARLEAVEKSEKIMVLERELNSEKQAAIGLRALVDTEKQKCSVLQKSHEEIKSSLEREIYQERAATKEEKGQLLAAVIQLQDTVELYERKLESEAEAQNAQILDSVAARLEAEGREASLQEQLRQATQAADSRERVLEEWAKKNSILQTEYDLLHESQEALRNQVSALREGVEQRDGTVQSLQVEAADLQGKLTQAKTLAAFLNSELKAECESIGALQEEFEDSKTQADEQAATADRMLELEKEKIRAHCNMLQHESTLTKTQLTSLQAELGARCESIRNLQTELDAVRMKSDEKSAALHKELETERNKAHALQRDFDAAKARWDTDAEKMSTELEMLREKRQGLQEAKAYAQSRSNMQSRFDNINLDTAGVVASEAPDPGQAAVVEHETKEDGTVITDISAPAEVYIVLYMELHEIRGKVCLFANERCQLV